MIRISKRLLLAVIVGFVAGALWLVTVRLITYKDPTIHYHANFAVYINGARETFDNFTFYEEVASCSADELHNPKIRAHMHDKKNHVVHVHDAGVTWGHFFANLGFTLGNDVLKTDKGRFVSGEDSNEIRFILNGKETDSIANQVILSRDVLLIDYGKSEQNVLDERFDGITKDAETYNTRPDPAACASGKPLDFGQRLKAALGF